MAEMANLMNQLMQVKLFDGLKQAPHVSPSCFLPSSKYVENELRLNFFLASLENIYEHFKKYLKSEPEKSPDVADLSVEFLLY